MQTNTCKYLPMHVNTPFSCIPTQISTNTYIQIQTYADEYSDLTRHPICINMYQCMSIQTVPYIPRHTISPIQVNIAQYLQLEM